MKGFFPTPNLLFTIQKQNRLRVSLGSFKKMSTYVYKHRCYICLSFIHSFVFNIFTLTHVSIVYMMFYNLLF